MKTLKFVTKDRSQFTATLRKNVNEYFSQNKLSTKGGWKIVLKSAIMLSAYIAPFVLIIVLPLPVWTIFPLAVLTGLGMAGTGMSVMHDGNHGSSSKKAWVNKLLGSSMYFMGSNVFTWKIQHNIKHHTFTNVDGYDEDVEGHGVVRLSPHTPLKKMHRFQYIYIFIIYSSMTLRRMVNDFMQLYQYNKSGITQEQRGKPGLEYSKLIGTKVAYLSAAFVLPLLFSGFSWWLLLLGFLTVHLTAAMIMSIVFQLAHVVEGVNHPEPELNGSIDNEWMIHQVETTSDFAHNNRLLSWYLGGLNFQIEHHLFPNICHIHYPKIAAIVEKTSHDFGLSYNLKPNLFSAVQSHIRTLKELGRPTLAPVTV